jgi:DNA-binding XRE family transcriptional regulator
MSLQPETVQGVPEWDIADRLRKSLRHAGVGVDEMADYLGVSRRSVGNWINGHIEPSRQTKRLWALRCGVDFNWLCHGYSSPCFDPGKPESSQVRPGIMNPCSWQGQTGTTRVISLPGKVIPLRTPQAA